MALFLVGASIYLISSFMSDIEDRLNQFKPDMFHEYSGIHPELYKNYLENKKKYQDTGERVFLVNALNSIEELALYADLDIREEIHEKILKQESLFI